MKIMNREVCIKCSGYLTRSPHTPDQPADSELCAPCWYNEHNAVKLLSLDELDELSDAIPDEVNELFWRLAHNSLVDWHSDIAPILLTEHGPRIKVKMECAICGGFPIVVYAGSGLHSGAWPYIYDEENNMLGNIRDQEYHCETCTKERQERNVQQNLA